VLDRWDLRAFPVRSDLRVRKEIKDTLDLMDQRPILEVKEIKE